MADNFEGLQNHEDEAQFQLNLVGGLLGSRPITTRTEKATSPSH